MRASFGARGSVVHYGGDRHDSRRHPEPVCTTLILWVGADQPTESRFGPAFFGNHCKIAEATVRESNSDLKSLHPARPSSSPAEVARSFPILGQYPVVNDQILRRLRAPGHRPGIDVLVRPEYRDGNQPGTG